MSQTRGLRIESSPLVEDGVFPSTIQEENEVGMGMEEDTRMVSVCFRWLCLQVGVFGMRDVFVCCALYADNYLGSLIVCRAWKRHRI